MGFSRSSPVEIGEERERRPSLESSWTQGEIFFFCWFGSERWTQGPRWLPRGGLKWRVPHFKVKVSLRNQLTYQEGCASRCLCDDVWHLSKLQQAPVFAHASLYSIPTPSMVPGKDLWNLIGRKPKTKFVFFSFLFLMMAEPEYKCNVIWLQK